MRLICIGPPVPTGVLPPSPSDFLCSIHISPRSVSRSAQTGPNAQTQAKFGTANSKKQSQDLSSRGSQPFHTDVKEFRDRAREEKIIWRMEHVVQLRSPIPYHDMPQHQESNLSRRPSSHTSAAAAAAVAAEVHHNIQSRTKSPSHGLSKRERSRSRGRKQHGRLTTNNTPKSQDNNFGNSNASSRFSEESTPSLRGNNYSNLSSRKHFDSAVVHGGSINELGRCVRHPHIELCCRDSASSPWRVVLRECPLCSLDHSKLHKPTTTSSKVVGDKINNSIDGATNSSQPSSSTTTTTHRTSTEEESSVKSWTMSDVSSGGRDSNKCNNPSGTNHRRTPPPPCTPNENQHSKNVTNSVQLLKELGRKLVVESQTSTGGGAAAAGAVSSDEVLLPTTEGMSTRPPPPPLNRRRQPQQQQQQPSSSARTSSRRMGAQASSSAASGGVGGDGTKGSILVEASDIIARMESLTKGELNNSNRSRRNSPHVKQPTDGVGVVEEDSVERVAAEKLERMQRRKERALRNAAKLKAREQLKQQQEYGEAGVEATTHSMIDPSTTSLAPRRGRVGPPTSDILFEAAQIRDRARRSASRSRERLKAAAIFCGEAPPVENIDQSEDNRSLLTTERKRSILNPHGYEEQPIPPAIERRSQSRERKWSSIARSTTANEAEGAYYISQAIVAKDEKRRGGNRGRSLPRTSIRQSEELLSRRRDMRQKIIDMKSSVQSRTENRRTWGTEQNTDDYLPSNDEEEWVHSSNDTEANRRGRPSERRRGRSRSAVRDGFSRMRSSSLNVFQKKAVQESDVENEVHTVDSGKLSIASFKHLLSRCRTRSLSLSRRRRSNQNDGSWLTDSEITMDRRGSIGSASADSEIGTTKSSSTSGIFNKLLSKGKHSNDPSRFRSLRRGHSHEHKRNTPITYEWEAMSEGLGSRGW